MKDYNTYIIWLDYIDSTLKRSQGRRVPLSLAVKNPTLRELELACSDLSLQASVIEARFPRRMWKTSGYAIVQKKGKKIQLLKEIAKAITKIRELSKSSNATKQKT